MGIVNKINGDFHLSPEEKIGRGDSYSKILSYKSVDSTWNAGNGYEWIYFKNKKIDNLYFNLQICFYKKQIKSISFDFHFELKENNWSDWTEDEEIKQQRIFEFWLNDNLGEKRFFDWGKANSCYDKKGGYSGIMLQYE